MNARGRSAPLALGLVLAAAAACGGPVGAPAAPGFRKAPYLQAAEGGIAVAWEAAEGGPARVAWRAAGEERSVPVEGAGPAGRVVLAGLPPGAAVSVRVESGAALGHLAFHVPAEDRTWTFVAFGDVRRGHRAHLRLAERMRSLEPAPDLVLQTGDLLDDAADPGEWDRFFALERDLLAAAPAAVAPGNHDDGGDWEPFRKWWPTSEPGRSWYSFDLGGAHFAVLDTNAPYGEGSPQHRWLDADLRAARAASRYVFVVGHHSPFTSGGHGVRDARDWRPVRRQLVPVFTRHRVDAVFTGHDHHYERGSVSGVTYVVTGGGGAPSGITDFLPDGVVDHLPPLPSRERVYADRLEAYPGWPVLAWLMGWEWEGAWWRQAASGRRHFVEARVAPDRVDFTVRDDRGEVLDRFHLRASGPTTRPPSAPPG